MGYCSILWLFHGRFEWYSTHTWFFGWDSGDNTGIVTRMMMEAVTILIEFVLKFILVLEAILVRTVMIVVYIVIVIVVIVICKKKMNNNNNNS